MEVSLVVQSIIQVRIYGDHEAAVLGRSRETNKASPRLSQENLLLERGDSGSYGGLAISYRDHHEHSRTIIA